MDIYSSQIPFLFAPKGEKAWAITLLPNTTFYSVPEEQVSESWRRHEDCHKEQWRRYWYIGFALLYLWYQWRYGYKKNPLEVEARSRESINTEA